MHVFDDMPQPQMHFAVTDEDCGELNKVGEER